ncbi:hypothetical protein CCP3SC1AL1_770004 [Gammaproteobacteria bacterium]
MEQLVRGRTGKAGAGWVERKLYRGAFIFSVGKIERPGGRQFGGT